MLARGGGELRGGLNRAAEALGVARVGPAHQAGSDSLLTSAVFFEVKRRLGLDEGKTAGVLFGMGPSAVNAVW